MGPWFSDRLPLNSKRLSDAAFTRTAERAFILVKNNDYFVEFGYLSSSCIIKRIILMFLSSSRINSRFCSKPQWQMFLLVSVRRHVGAYPDGSNMASPSKFYILLKKNYCDLNLRWLLCIFIFFPSPDSGLYLLKGFDFNFDLFWMAWQWKPAISSRAAIWRNLCMNKLVESLKAFSMGIQIIES